MTMAIKVNLTWLIDGSSSVWVEVQVVIVVVGIWSFFVVVGLRDNPSWSSISSSNKLSSSMWGWIEASRLSCGEDHVRLTVAFRLKKIKVCKNYEIFLKITFKNSYKCCFNGLTHQQTGGGYFIKRAKSSCCTMSNLPINWLA